VTLSPASAGTDWTEVKMSFFTWVSVSEGLVDHNRAAVAATMGAETKSRRRKQSNNPSMSGIRVDYCRLGHEVDGSGAVIGK